MFKCLLRFFFLHSKRFRSFWLIGHFEVIRFKVYEANITKIIFTIILVDHRIESQILKSILYLLLHIQTK